jgi:hypothetical protein
VLAGHGSDADGVGDTRQMPVIPAAQRTEPRRPGPAGSLPQAGRSAVGVLELGGAEPAEAGTVTSERPGTGGAGTPATRTAAGAPAPEAGTRPPLPHRRPQHHLVPELLEDGSAEAGAPAGPVRSPEDARNRFAKYQRGWAEGRSADRDDPNPNAEQGGNA